MRGAASSVVYRGTGLRSPTGRCRTAGRYRYVLRALDPAGNVATQHESRSAAHPPLYPPGRRRASCTRR